MLDGPRLAPASGGPPDALVVLLHGYGSNGADLIALAPMWRHALPHAAFVAPNAPERCPGMPGGYQWWALTSFDRAAMAAGARRAAATIDAFLDAELAAASLKPDRLLLVGFSQGTMMALHVGPRRADPVAGIIGYSGMLADPLLPDADIRSRPPILLVHGDRDDIVPLRGMHEAERELKRRGFAVEAHISPGLAHGVDPAGLAHGERFARRVLG